MTEPKPDTQAGKKSMDEIMSLCKRRGFVYPASEIYGGINGFWDYGPLGAQLKKNLRDAWWHDVVMMGCRGKTGPDGNPVRVVPVDTCIIQNPKVWEASGHVAGFNDPMVIDKSTPDGKRFRADHLIGFYFSSPDMTAGDAEKILADRAKSINPEKIPDLTLVGSSSREAVAEIANDRKLQKTLGIGQFEEWPTGPLGEEAWARLTYKGTDYIACVKPVPMSTLEAASDRVPSPFIGKAGGLTPPRAFNLMFKTYIGATATEDDIAYLRPETAQGIFIHFKNVVDTTRVRLPFGIAQTGKSFRNEVTPRNFTFRSREFEQMEIEFFCPPDQAADWYAFWRDERMAWWQSLGLAGDNLVLREHEQDELSHYSSGTSDIEYRFPFTFPGFGELEGVANRGCYDLTQHQEHSKVKLDYFDQEKNERYIPHVIEPSAGLDRGVLALLCEAYTPDPDRPSQVYMKFHPRIAPIKAAIFPLVNKDGMPEKAVEIYQAVVRRIGAYGFVEYDPKQNIGKRYARMDEAGCPFCFTVDADTLQDGTVTVRDRDTLAQERIAASEVPEFLARRLGLGS